MARLSRLKTGRPMARGAWIAILFTLAVVMFGVNRIAAMDRDLELNAYDWVVKIKLTQAIENEVNRQSRSLHTALIASGPGLVDRELAKVEASRSVVVASVDSLKHSVSSVKERMAFDALIETRANFETAEETLLGLIKASHVWEARSFMVNEMLTSEAAYLEAIEAFAKYQEEGLESFASEAKQLAMSAYKWLLSLAGGAVLLAFGLALSRARRQAKGDLWNGRVSCGKRETALNNVADKLEREMLTVRLRADEVATASTQLAMGSLYLGSSTEEHAVALRQTIASMEQFIVSVRHNSASAVEANRLPQKANNAAQDCVETEGDLICTVKEINGSLVRVVNLVEVLNGIAFQINVLAPNAAVEVARPADQGLRFSVVAAEEGNFTWHCADVANDIK